MSINYNHWKDIPGYEGLYQANRKGEILSLHENNFKKKLIPSKHTTGYLVVSLSKNGVRKKHKIHRLILLTFVGVCPNGKEVNHKNGIRTDNRLKNLEYVTRLENIRHQFHVLGNYPLDRTWTKIADSIILEIRRLYADGLSQNSIAKKFGLGRTTVAKIVHRKTHKNI